MVRLLARNAQCHQFSSESLWCRYNAETGQISKINVEMPYDLPIYETGWPCFTRVLEYLLPAN